MLDLAHASARERRDVQLSFAALVNSAKCAKTGQFLLSLWALAGGTRTRRDPLGFPESSAPELVCGEGSASLLPPGT